MSGRIILFKGFSQYDVVRHFIDDLAVGFQNLGRETLIIDLTSQHHNVQLLQDAFSKECDFICGFNLNGFDLGLGQEGIKFIKDMGIPYVGILVDSPLYHFDKFSIINAVGMPENYLITCVDKLHLNVLKYYCNASFATFLPHAGTCAAGINPYKGMNSRSRDVVFGASFSKPNVSWRDSPMKPLLDDIAEYMLSSENIQVQDALLQILKTKNYSLNPDFFKRILAIVVYVDIYVRNVWRARTITELVGAGIKLDLYGDGWEQLSCTKYCNVHKAVNFHEMLRVMRDTKIVLNLANFFTYGSHERVFSAMLNGAVALTDVNEYWQDAFVEDQEIVTYSITNPDRLSRKIMTLLTDLPQLDDIAKAGQKKAEQCHTWKERAQEIIRLVQMMDGFRSIKI